MRLSLACLFCLLSAAGTFAQDGPYKVLKSAKVGGEGGFDYVYADSTGRKLYVARSGPAKRISVYDLDSLAPVGEMPEVGAHGVVVDPKTHHGIASSKPVVMFDSDTLKPIKTIEVEGNPDGLLFDRCLEPSIWGAPPNKPQAMARVAFMWT